MKEIVREVELDDDTLNYVERLHYEFQGNSVLMTSILKNKYFTYDTETYKVFKKEYDESFCILQMALNELFKIYRGKMGEYCEVDFRRKTLMFYTTDEGKCNCG